ncbi:putative adipose-regulatory protein-domain-containing protein [Circinella umbellata]|nr:putative adipose-regulatory protein-domain-containing protein [Circinella umbellata]
MEPEASRSRREQQDNSDNFQVVPSTPSYSDTEEPLLRHDQDQEDPSDSNQELAKAEGDIEELEPVEWSPAMKMIGGIIKKVASPVLRIVFAPQAQRTFIKGTAIVIVLLWVLLTSITAYITFYRQYVPKTAHIEPIYFQYHQQQEGPLGVVDLTHGKSYAPLRHEQAYDVSIRLHVPTSDINFDLGNFMIKTWLQTADGTSVVHSSRPAILRYQSKTQRILHVFAKALPLLVGLSEESQVITVPLIKGYMEDKSKSVTQATVSVSTNQLQLYDANIHVIADFRGLRHYMYHRRFITASGFIIMFILIEIICAAIAWKFFGQNLWNKIHAVFEQMELEEQLRREEQENPEDGSVAAENHNEEEEDGYDAYHNEQNPSGSSTGVDANIHHQQRQQRH